MRKHDIEAPPVRKLPGDAPVSPSAETEIVSSLQSGDLAWLNELRYANMDDAALQKVLQDRPSLLVETKLNTLAKHLARGEDENGCPIRSVLLVAHAGDGKTHFLKKILSHSLKEHSKDTQTKPAVFWYPEDGVPLTEPGIHIFNDPTPARPEVRQAFLNAAFHKPSSDCIFIASANRGLLRDIILNADTASLEKDAKERLNKDAKEWLNAAYSLAPDTHHVDIHGRLAIPLDRRTLVPGPGDIKRVTEAPCYKLADAILTEAALPLTDEKDRWARRIAIALAMVEASGHHVTFRESMALGASVVAALAKSEQAAWSTLFHEGKGPQTLQRIQPLLRRMDPARVATPQFDLRFKKQSDRDFAVRKDGWDKLVDLFCGIGGELPILPYASAVHFLDLCKQVGAANRAAVNALRTLAKLKESSKPLAELFARTQNELVESSVPFAGNEQDSSDLFRGLSRVAWGASGGALSHDVLPLASPLQPGTSRGANRWRVLRAAIGLEQARFRVKTLDPGEYVECGLVLPELVMDGPAHLPASPPMRLDLEIFDLLSRIGRGHHPPELGNRGPQVAGWLEAVVRTWESAWNTPQSGFVVYQTLINEQTSKRSVPLRPPKPGEQPSGEPLLCTNVESINDFLLELWPITSNEKQNLAITPAACANALLVWSGFAPSKKCPAGNTEAIFDLRDALGNGHLHTLHRRTRYRTIAFPWSNHLIGRGLQSDGSFGDLRKETSTLGACIARALGLDEHWKESICAAYAEDEPELDTHPSSLLVHDWLGVGAAGIQLGDYPRSSAPKGGNALQQVLSALLGRVPFSGTERWWLVGVLSAWALMGEAVRELHERHQRPVWLPAAASGAGQSAYQRTIDGWLLNNKRNANHAIAIGQASGFLSPPSLPRNFQMSLSSCPGIVDLVRLAAWQVCASPAAERTVEGLQRFLLDIGLYTLNGGVEVRERLPEGAISTEAPDSHLFDADLRERLVALSLLDVGSDGANLIRSPWEAR